MSGRSTPYIGPAKGQNLVRLGSASSHAQDCAKLSDFPSLCKSIEKSPDTKPPPNRPMPVKVYIRPGEVLGPRFWGHSIHPHRPDRLPQCAGVPVYLCFAHGATATKVICCRRSSRQGLLLTRRQGAGGEEASGMLHTVAKFDVFSVLSDV